MADVFLSYKREDKEALAKIAEALDLEGVSVWWDQELTAGASWDIEIERQIALAPCVIVVWTHGSVESRNVRCEADFATEAGTLVPIRLEDCRLPLFQRTTQVHDLRDWTGDRDDKSWRSLVERVRLKIAERIARNHVSVDPRSQLPMWGFGLAPPKPHTWRRYNDAAESVRNILLTRSIGDLPTSLDSLSQVQGLFNRVRRKDQWDWFIVWHRLGLPAIGHIRKLAEVAAGLRTAAKEGVDIQPLISAAKKENMVGVLNVFLGNSTADHSQDTGILFILSAKHKPEISFVGIATSDVVEIADRLNSALRLKSPLGVFHAWRVRDARDAESAVFDFITRQYGESALDMIPAEIRLVSERHEVVRDGLERLVKSEKLLEQYATSRIDE